MGEYFRYYDLTSWEIFWEVVYSFGWIIAMPLVFYCIELRSGLRKRPCFRSWQALPFLAWATIATWGQIEFLEALAMSHGPPAAEFFLIVYISVLALGALCTSHALVCTLAGLPSWSPGVGALQRGAVHMAVLATLADGLFVALVLRGFLAGSL